MKSAKKGIIWAIIELIIIMTVFFIVLIMVIKDISIYNFHIGHFSSFIGVICGISLRHPIKILMYNKLLKSEKLSEEDI